MGSNYVELDRKIDSIISQADRMFIATAVGGNSCGSSVFLARDGQDLIFFTFRPTWKAEQIRVNPEVCCVIWHRGQEGIRGPQVEGECHLIRDPAGVLRSRNLILEVTTAFKDYMQDEFLIKNKVVGYYRIRPTVIKYIDFYARPKFEWREYPENRVSPAHDFFRSLANRLLLWIRAVREVELISLLSLIRNRPGDSTNKPADSDPEPSRG